MKSRQTDIPTWFIRKFPFLLCVYQWFLVPVREIVLRPLYETCRKILLVNKYISATFFSSRRLGLWWTVHSSTGLSIFHPKQGYFHCSVQFTCLQNGETADLLHKAILRELSGRGNRKIAKNYPPDNWRKHSADDGMSFTWLKLVCNSSWKWAPPSKLVRLCFLVLLCTTTSVKFINITIMVTSMRSDPPVRVSCLWMGNTKFFPNKLCSFRPAANPAHQCKFPVLLTILLVSLVAFTVPKSLHLEPGLG